jgi:hypothetical protein
VEEEITLDQALEETEILEVQVEQEAIEAAKVQEVQVINQANQGFQVVLDSDFQVEMERQDGQAEVEAAQEVEVNHHLVLTKVEQEVQEDLLIFQVLQ